VKRSDNEIVNFLMSLDPPRIIIPDCDPEQFEKIISVNSRFLRLSLIEGQLEIMPPLPVHIKFGAGECEIIGQIACWRNDNKNFVGITSASQGAFRLLKLEDPNYPNKRTVLSPDSKKILFPPVAPNSIIELRSKYDSVQLLHEKMLKWVKAGVDEAISIDFNIDQSEVRIYSFDPDANKVVWNPKKDSVEVKSRVLEGLVLNMQEIKSSIYLY
ncbi:hypothetical protein C2G38_2084830, partial [Gigaspora rosea]